MDRNIVEEVFKEELSSFEGPDQSILDFTIQILVNLPDYFLSKNAKGENNRIIIHTKTCVNFANTLLSLKYFQEKFRVSERNMIRAALLLHDGMLFGDGSDLKEKHEHPEYMAIYLRNEAWDKFLPSFIREDIAAMIETHSGEWNKKDGCLTLKVPKSEMQHFVHICIYLSSRSESSIHLPAVVSYYEKIIDKMKYDQIKDEKKNGLDFQTASNIVNQMITGRQWDGMLYSDSLDTSGCSYAYLDGQKVPVPSELKMAFYTVGEAYRAKLQQNAYLSDQNNKVQNRPYTWNEFVSYYPDWNQMIYGNPGGFYIFHNGQNFSISDDQARALGLNF